MNFTLTFTGSFIDSRCVTASMIRHAKHCVTPWNNGCGRWLPAEACSVGKKKKTEITGNWRQKAIIITLNQKQKVIIIIST